MEEFETFPCDDSIKIKLKKFSKPLSEMPCFLVVSKMHQIETQFLIRSFLKTLFPTKFVYKENESIVVCSHTKKIKVKYISSLYHYEFDPSKFGYSDKYVISKTIMSLVSMPSIFDTIKIIVIFNCDKLSKYSQAMLHKIIETYSLTTRFIFISSSYNIDKAIISRCSTIVIPKPSNILLRKYLKSFKESVNYEEKTITTLINNCNNSPEFLQFLNFIYFSTGKHIKKTF